MRKLKMLRDDYLVADKIKAGYYMYTFQQKRFEHSINK